MIEESQSIGSYNGRGMLRQEI